MSNKILIEIITPDKTVVSKNVDTVVATSLDGEFAVLYGHIPLLAVLDISKLYFRFSNKIEYVSLSGGISNVTSDKVTILADTAELSNDIDIDRAKKVLKKAEEYLKTCSSDDINIDDVKKDLSKSKIRLDVSNLGNF